MAQGFSLLGGMAIFVAATMTPQTLFAQQRQDEQPEIREGRIYNASDRPFAYQLRRSRGKAWTQILRLQPGEFHVYRGRQFGGRDDLAGLLARPSRLREGYLVIQFPGYDGMRRFRIRATDLQGRIAPYWFYVTDSAGQGHLVQARSLEQAKAIQEDMQQQPVPSDEELAALKRKLEANHVFYPFR